MNVGLIHGMPVSLVITGTPQPPSSPSLHESSRMMYGPSDQKVLFWPE